MRRQGGFTFVELIAVMVLIGILAAFALPRLLDRNGSASLAFGDQVVSSLRLAQKTATAHRRLVCATVGANAVTLGMAMNPIGSAGQPNGCDGALAGVGADDYRSSADAVTASVALAGAAANAATTTLYFQPDGTITLDVAGTNPAAGDILVKADGQLLRTIQLAGSTGYVE